MNKKVNIGIYSIGTYMPKDIHDSFYISNASGIPEQVIREKFGIKQVHKASKNESVSYMGVQASKKALGNIDPMTIDLVVYCGSEYKDYYLFNCATKIREELGAMNAIAFEIHNLCSSGVYSLKILKSMMIQDESLKTVLLVSSSKEGDLINYKDTDSRFMFNFGDGAAAAVLKRDYDKNVILESSMIVDGRFAADVSVPAIGSINRHHFTSLPTDDYYLKVRNLEEMKNSLDPITLNNFYKVMDHAVEKSGFSKSDVNFVAPICMKKSMLDALLQHFNLNERNSFLLENYGHCQSADCFISIEEGVKDNRISDGDLIVMVAAGTGYTWASTTIKWGAYDK